MFGTGGHTYLNEEDGYAVGIDIPESQNKGTNAEQIILTGWVNALPGTGVSAMIRVDPDETTDGDIYTKEMLSELGGNLEVRQVPRYLEKLGKSVTGNKIYNDLDGGVILSMSLPFLEDGAHRIAVSYNISLPGEEAEWIDLDPVDVTIDSSVRTRKDAEEKIEKEWTAELPESVQEQITELPEDLYLGEPLQGELSPVDGSLGELSPVEQNPMEQNPAESLSVDKIPGGKDRLKQ